MPISVLPARCIVSTMVSFLHQILQDCQLTPHGGIWSAYLKISVCAAATEASRTQARRMAPDVMGRQEEKKSRQRESWRAHRSSMSSICSGPYPCKQRGDPPRRASRYSSPASHGSLSCQGCPCGRCSRRVKLGDRPRERALTGLSQAVHESCSWLCSRNMTPGGFGGVACTSRSDDA